MDVFKIAAIAVIAASLALLVRTYRPEMALQVTIVAGAMVLIMVVLEVSGLITAIQTLAQRYGIETEYIGLLIKIIGIAYVAQFAVQVCKDAGEAALSAKVELAGRVMILTAALPAVVALLDMIAALLPGTSAP